MSKSGSPKAPHGGPNVRGEDRVVCVCVFCGEKNMEIIIGHQCFGEDASCTILFVCNLALGSWTEINREDLRNWEARSMGVGGEAAAETVVAANVTSWTLDTVLWPRTTPRVNRCSSLKCLCGFRTCIRSMGL